MDESGCEQWRTGARPVVRAVRTAARPGFRFAVDRSALLRGLRKSHGLRAAPAAHPAMPWQAAVLVLADLARRRGGAKQARRLEAAQCLALQFDTYLRPGYAAQLTAGDVLLPVARRRGVVTVMMRQSDPAEEGSREDSRAAARGVELRRPGLGRCGEVPALL